MQEMQLPVPEQLEENISALTTALNSYYRATAGVASGAGKQKLIDDMRASQRARRACSHAAARLARLARRLASRSSSSPEP